ncbi:MAG: methylenetetrahydrofolate reductase [NAD(P)H] [Planctomycetes bacterium]|nr:methylenetetrahydrofolate reductase [NAD(P)H] [Planctomycetota bacterium]
MNRSIAAHYSAGKLGISFELFPPKTADGDETLLAHVRELVRFQPGYITCTYGAGGSTRDRTLEIVRRVKKQFQIPIASHLTCVGSTVDQLRRFLADAEQHGVDYVVALRGDPPRGELAFQAVEGGLRYANELVQLIRSEFPQFGIAVAGYPETHREAASPQADLENLKRKLDAGGQVVLTQLFYNNDDFLRFRDRCQAIGIRAPIVPGILPVTNLAQIQKITALCGAKLPTDFVEQLSRNADSDWQFQVGIEFATRQVMQLVRSGIPGLHFYVLNKSQATAAVLNAVGIARAS